MILNFKEVICDYINNVENEEYCKLTDEQVDEISESIWEKVAYDNELQGAINNTIEYYVGKYLALKNAENNEEV